MLQKFSTAASMLFLILLLSNCKKSSNPPVNTTTNFTISLSGANESTTNASPAAGSGTATFNGTSKVFTMNVTFSGITATAAHIHNGLSGVPGPVEFSLTPSSPINFTVTMSATQENDLMEGKYYVNVHSAAFPGGEIRGQIVKQ
ncbi:MAG: CHRD domain-containing protein [Sphingobacteriales bacterium]|nr:CHRD domain-containing protein [Sphingobacteriales bacterium]